MATISQVEEKMHYIALCMWHINTWHTHALQIYCLTLTLLWQNSFSNLTSNKELGMFNINQLLRCIVQGCPVNQLEDCSTYNNKFSGIKSMQQQMMWKINQELEDQEKLNACEDRLLLKLARKELSLTSHFHQVQVKRRLKDGGLVSSVINFQFRK